MIVINLQSAAKCTPKGTVGWIILKQMQLVYWTSELAPIVTAFASETLLGATFTKGRNVIIISALV